jgi:hypothetical protein
MQKIHQMSRRGTSLATRRSEYDVSNRVNTTDPAAVHNEVSRVFLALYPDASLELVARAFADCGLLYRGEYPGYHGCDTGYHNLQHVLDVTLAMARLMDGYERARHRSEPIGPRVFGLGVITALFHDIGYLRHRNDTRHRKGAEYTLRHVSRGARFLERYLSDAGMPDLAPVAARIIHFTGYEIPVQRIEVPSLMFRMIGNMLGTADIMAQMADRCYLEKCRDRLYPEFVDGGLASPGQEGAAGGVAVFSSAEDLLRKTPGFYQSATARLTDHLGATYRYVTNHFGGQNLYLDEVVKNIRYAERVAANNDFNLLRRVPPPKYLEGEVLIYRAVTRLDASDPADDPSPAAPRLSTVL